MKKAIILAFAIGALVVSSVSTQAGLFDTFTNYTDVSVYEHYSASDPINNIFVPTPLGPNAVNNTFADAAGTTNINAYATDGDTATFGPGFRWLDVVGNPGGGSDRAYNGNLYFYRSDYSPNGSPDGYTRIGGLQPGKEYQVGMWSIQGGTKDTVSTSLDLGATWSTPIDTPVIDAAILAGTADWLAHSTADAYGTPGVKDGDTRFRILLDGTQVANGAGEVIVGFRDPNLRSTGGTSDRGRIDGFAVRCVPEPTTLALAGLSVVGLLIRRRNRG
ncbi:PEP-CTERM sorting domain-containing protein [Bythopirellula polymerisocia]|uniref:Ice-binding protein C-terminal domain-containing protein n=1 Tax=Bythopirellula polymerisocia TaxID=2528003 RepID=A0A5C6CWG0_9BACT|nr:PEP-CTERM sorting domain-containing protein [Bythopirellula polymerisocia]TWU27751.1 hypothetical protein Pla144_25280 [Bythopirellula polymerisocia]